MYGKYIFFQKFLLLFFFTIDWNFWEENSIVCQNIYQCLLPWVIQGQECGPRLRTGLWRLLGPAHSDDEMLQSPWLLHISTTLQQPSASPVSETITFNNFAVMIHYWWPPTSTTSTTTSTTVSTTTTSSTTGCSSPVTSTTMQSRRRCMKRIINTRTGELIELILTSDLVG